MIEPGDVAPDFELPDQHGNPVRLSDLRGKTVVLYFYPKADTPGCTTQACGVRDHRADYANANTVVLGVSPDPVKPIAKFDEKYGLGFPLLSDEDHSVAEAYGVWVEREARRARRAGVGRAGRPVGVRRSTGDPRAPRARA
jgi:peroxiredoxin Q/BCP